MVSKSVRQLISDSQEGTAAMVTNVHDREDPIVCLVELVAIK